MLRSELSHNAQTAVPARQTAPSVDTAARDMGSRPCQALPPIEAQPADFLPLHQFPTTGAVHQPSSFTNTADTWAACAAFPPRVTSAHEQQCEPRDKGHSRSGGEGGSTHRTSQDCGLCSYSGRRFSGYSSDSCTGMEIRERG